jgi:hypothetical protein
MSGQGHNPMRLRPSGAEGNFPPRRTRRAPLFNTKGAKENTKVTKGAPMARKPTGAGVGFFRAAKSRLRVLRAFLVFFVLKLG